jgi:predicted transposase YdaD
MTENTPEIVNEVVQEAPKPVRKKAAKAAAPEAGGKREWVSLVPEIRRLREEGRTVPEIAQELELPYILVNQVMVQSYKMTVDTVAHFERHEERRLAAE